MRIEELLKKYISEELVEDLMDFVEELYLKDYAYLILMARKFSNLFFLFHALNCEKYERWGIPYKNKGGIIVSNRALPLLTNVLKDGEHKIVIGDDVIIHGRGIRDLYQELKDLNPKIDIEIDTYIINNRDTTEYQDIIDKIRRYYDVSMDRWRDVSDRIVTSFLIAGRPYISYLPYFVLDTTWEELTKKIDSKNSVWVENFDFKYYSMDLLVYYGEEFLNIQELKSCSIAAVRFYNCKEAGRILAVPYFCMEVIKQPCLKILSDKIRNTLFTKEYNEKVRLNENAESMRIMELEYTISLLIARSLFSKLGIGIKEWSRDIERSTFGGDLVNVGSFDEIDAEKQLKTIIECDAEITICKPEFATKEKDLSDAYKELKKKYKRDFLMMQNARYRIGDDNNYIRKYVEELLHINGELDEARCNNPSQEERSRLLGLPLSFVLSDSAAFWQELNSNCSLEYYKRKVFAEIIAAVDTGKGSIVINQVGDQDDKKTSESLLHAGEQNYKYHEPSNYPYMYGMMVIEYEYSKRKVSKDIIALKEAFQERFDEYLNDEQMIYSIDEQNELTDINMMDEYGDFLLNVHDKYVDDEVLERAKAIAFDVIKENCYG